MPFCTPANLLTLCRIPLALFLLFVAPLSPDFFLFYVLAGITDMLDGPLARRSHTANRTGAWLDSLADTVFLAAMLFRLLPAVTLPHWAPLGSAVSLSPAVCCLASWKPEIPPLRRSPHHRQ